MLIVGLFGQIVESPLTEDPFPETLSGDPFREPFPVAGLGLRVLVCGSVWGAGVVGMLKGPFINRRQYELAESNINQLEIISIIIPRYRFTNLNQ